MEHYAPTIFWTLFRRRSNVVLCVSKILTYVTNSQIKSETNVDRIRRLQALRTLLSHLLLESFLEPGSTDDIAAELVICCSKAFPDLPELSKIAPSLEVEDESEGVPPVMDVLLDVLLSLLAKGSSPVRLAAEKVSLSMICYAKITLITMFRL